MNSEKFLGAKELTKLFEFIEYFILQLLSIDIFCKSRSSSPDGTSSFPE